MHQKLRSFILKYEPLKTVNGEQKKVVISMMRPAPHQYIELILAKILKANNFIPTLLFCNEQMFLEDFQYRNDYKRYTGYMKYKFFFNFLYKWRLKTYTSLCKLLDINFVILDKKKSKEKISKANLMNMKSSFNRIRASVPRKIPIFIEDRINNNVLFVNNFFENNKFDFCISSHGIYSLWGPIYEKMKNKIIIWGGDVYNKGHMILADGPIQLFNSKSFPKQENKNHIKFDQWIEDRSRIRSIDQESFRNTNNEFFIEGKKSKLYKKNELNGLLNSNKRKVLIMPNTLWDGDIDGRNAAFNGQLDWIKKTSEIEDLQIIVRAHPAEKSLKQFSPKIWNLLDKSTKSKIIYFPSDFVLNSYDLSEFADICCVYDSIIGIELNGMRKNVIICANNRHYLDINWNIPNNFQEYKERLLKKDLNENRYKLAENSYNNLINGSINIPFWNGEVPSYNNQYISDNNWERLFLEYLMEKFKYER